MRRMTTDIFLCLDIFLIYLNLFFLLINRTRTFLMAEQSPHFWQIMQNSFTSNIDRCNSQRMRKECAEKYFGGVETFGAFGTMCGASPHPSPPQPARSRYDLAKSTKRHQVSFTASQPSYLHTVHHTFSRTALQPAHSQLA